MSATTNTDHMKPNTHQAMSTLLQQIESALPLSANETELCEGSCSGCPKKLCEFMNRELEEWRWALQQGEQPSLGDLQSLAKTARKVQKALWKNEHLRPLMLQPE